MLFGQTHLPDRPVLKPQQRFNKFFETFEIMIFLSNFEK